METTFKKALDQIKADDNLKKKTAEYVLNMDSNVISINSTTDFKRKPLFAKRLITAACIAAVLCALPIGSYAYYKTPTSYVSVDINPSVELGINAFGKVVTVKAFNTDGDTVITGLSLLDSNVESAVRLIVKSAAQNGFIKEDGSSFIAVTAETNNEKKAEKLKHDAQTGAEDAIQSEKDTATIETDTVALDKRVEAIDLGISPGKLNLIQKLQQLDPTIKTEDYKNASVSVIQKKFVELKKDNTGSNHQDVTASPSSSASPSASPSVSPDGSTKPGNGNNNGNGNGNKKDNASSVNPSADNHETKADGSTPSGNNSSSGKSGDTTHANNNNHGHSNNGNGKS